MATSNPVPKPPNQGSPGTPHVAPPRISDKQPGGGGSKGSAPMQGQPARRGIHTPGKGGTGTTHSGPKSF